MAKLPVLSGKEVARVAEKLGFVYSHTTGSHAVYKHLDGRRTTIPIHAGEEIGPGLLSKIIKHDFRITREEFLKYLYCERNGEERKKRKTREALQDEYLAAR